MFFIPWGHVSNYAHIWAIVTSISHMGEMRDSDWSREILLRSDWSGLIGAPFTTVNTSFRLKAANKAFFCCSVRLRKALIKYRGQNFFEYSFRNNIHVKISKHGVPLRALVPCKCYWECSHRQPERTMCGFGLQRSFGRNILELLVYYLMLNKRKNLKDMKSSCLSICTSSL